MKGGPKSSLRPFLHRALQLLVKRRVTTSSHTFVAKMNILRTVTPPLSKKNTTCTF